MKDSTIGILPKNKWPKRLLEIPDLPEKLYIQGNLPSEDPIWLCVVGSRKFSQYGKMVCETLLASLRGQNVVIVSGLALGIDSIAHRKALAIGLKTIAIPGSGLNENVIHPSIHKNLAREILKNDGCLLSEFEPDFKATLYSFPQRNRIMAGLSQAVLIIEAEKRSGTLITARLALDYNRDVYAVPGSIFSPTSEGTNFLIKNGATPITSTNDFLEVLGFSAKQKENKYADCSEKELKIIELLREPTHRDELIRASGLSSSEAQILLSVMELKGLITEKIGQIQLTN